MTAGAGSQNTPTRLGESVKTVWMNGVNSFQLVC